MSGHLLAGRVALTCLPSHRRAKARLARPAPSNCRRCRDYPALRRQSSSLPQLIVFRKTPNTGFCVLAQRLLVASGVATHHSTGRRVAEKSCAGSRDGFSTRARFFLGFLTTPSARAGPASCARSRGDDPGARCNPSRDGPAKACRARCECPSARRPHPAVFAG